MSFVRARKVTALPVPTQPNTIYAIATANPKEEQVIVTDGNNVQTDLGLKQGYMINKKLLTAA